MASKGVNKVIIIGNLGRDPDVRHTPNGSQVTSIAIATSESWKDKNTGEVHEKTEWHNVTFFGKLAEIAGQYLTKGSQVYVEGKLKTDKYQDKKTGQDRYSTGIVVDSFSGVLQMLGGGNKGSNKSQGEQPSREKTHKQNNQPASQEFDNEFDDDIPF